MLKMAGQKKAGIMGSNIVKENNNYFSRMYAVYPDGIYRFYDKRHLFALGEEQDFLNLERKRLLQT